MLRAVSEIVTLTILGVSSSGTSAIGLAVLSVANNDTTLSTETWIPLGLFLGGIAMTATVVWKVAAHKTQTDSKIEAMQKKIEWLEKQQNK